VWLTFESLGDDDPALRAHPDLPVVVVFDAPLLARLQLSGKRLVFLAETVASLATRRQVSVHRGVVPDALAGTAVAVTHAPVPGFARRSATVDVVERHPWRWLVRPTGGPAQSFSAWRRGVRAP
jgi:deoxyribodipyrimidine photo-lyase